MTAEMQLDLELASESNELAKQFDSDQIKITETILNNIQNSQEAWKQYFDFVVEYSEDTGELVSKEWEMRFAILDELMAETDIELLQRHGFDKLPICIAKTPLSLSDTPGLRGRPKGFRITINELRVSAGAGFVVVICGNIMTMPGLPKVPAAVKFKLLE